jgi:hypothetical protein
VHPHLVGSSGPQLRLDQADARERLERPDYGMGRAAAGSRCQCRPAGPGPRASDPTRHEHLTRDVPAHERKVTALHGVGAELTLQVLSRCVGKRQHEDPRGVAVETVHHQDPSVATGAAFDFGCGAREHGVLLARGCRVHQQAGRLIDHQQVGVEVEDLDRRGPGRTGSLREVGVVPDGVTLPDDRTRIGDHGPVDEHVTHEYFALGVRVRGTQQLLCGAPEPSRSSFHDARVTPRGPSAARWTPARFSG